MILKVARLGFPSVRTGAQAVPVARIGAPEFQRLIDDMVETMYEYHGVGLAAPQVHLPISSRCSRSRTIRAIRKCRRFR